MAFPKITINYVLSVDGDNARAKIHAWFFVTQIFTLAMICGVFYMHTKGWLKLPLDLGVTHIVGAILVVAVGVLAILKRTTDLRGTPGKIQAKQVSPGVFRVENLRIPLLKSLSESEAFPE